MTRAALLLPGLLYGLAVRLRNGLYDMRLLPVRRLPCPVVAFGNLTVGGTGKTPLTSFTASMLCGAGYRVGIVSRGYRRTGRTPLLVSDGGRLLADASRSGDEPYLMARASPAAAVAVGADREAAAALIFAAAPPEVMLLDDAFQHRSTARDVDILLVDGDGPFGNGKMLPFGPLREPIAGIRRADAVVVTRGGGAVATSLAQALERHHPDAPVFHAAIEPRGFSGPAGEAIASASLGGVAAFAFAGIARPDRFAEDLRRLGLRLAGVRWFPDHHPYRPGDLEEVAAAARGAGAEILVTTEKDRVRLPHLPTGAPPVLALVIGVTFADDRFTGFILDRIVAAGARNPWEAAR